MPTKQEQIIQYIINLKSGEKISVRQIAAQLHVSEGTAYRAIKEAEHQGYVSTIERVGTVRIENKENRKFDVLTYSEVVNIVDGTVLGGEGGLSKTLNRFIIGAMQLDAMLRYVEAGDLLIIGNRENVHQYALNSGASMLITGGFDTSSEIKKMANELNLPVISTSYDTFTVATMINRAIDDRLIKKEIMHVEDILTPLSHTSYLYETDKVKDWIILNHKTSHQRYPVVNQDLKVVGIITTNDGLDHDESSLIKDVMIKQPITASPSMTVTSAAHMMIWEDIKCLPIVDANKHLLGIITQQDVLKAIQTAQRQPQVGETIDDHIASRIIESDSHQSFYECVVTPQMTDLLGTLSYGILTSIVTTVGRREMSRHRKGDLAIENVSLYLFKPIQIDQKIHIKPNILDLTRRNSKIDIGVYVHDTLCGKAMLSVQFIPH
ncbi:DRTGG domain-containing protein [Terrilactibacillus laevilacticus]|uniref:DRTGG domain-containing protein n=1 Tax=Terrilactibacillus laevilacticus TaxID=1380157 RepID=A0ABW5PTM9_9BACI|nr:DRTGG domain-containing protein [Terrilactibacillus laevilacticus]